MRLSLFLVCPLALASAVSAQIYVDPQNGSDSTGDGSQSNPYQTLSFAVPQAPSFSGEIVLFNGSGGAAVASEATGENFPITISKELTIRGEKLGAALIESTSASASPEIFSFVGGNDPNLSYYLELYDLELRAAADAIEYTPSTPGISYSYLYLERVRIDVDDANAIRAGFSSDPGIVTLSDCRLVGRSSGQTDESLISFFSVTDFDDPPILQVGRTVLQGGGTCIEVACNEASVLFGLGNCVLRDAYYGVRMQGVPTTPDPFHGALLHCTLRNLEVAVDEPSSFLQLFDVNFRFNLFEGNGLDVGSNVNFDPLSSDNYTDLTPPSGTSSFTQVSGLSGMFADCTEMLRPDATILGVVSSGSGIDLYGRTYTGDSDPGAVYHFSADQLVTQHPAAGEDVCLATHGPAGDTWFLVVGTSLVSTTPYALQVNPVDYPAFGAVDSTGFAQYPGTGQTPITIPNQPAFYTTPLYWQVGFQDPVTMALTFTHSAIRTDAGSIAE